MDYNKINNKIGALESYIDLLESELCYLSILLAKCGFIGGIESFKNAVEELMSSSFTDEGDDEPSIDY